MVAITIRQPKPYEDDLETPDDGYRWEPINGKMVALGIATRRHQLVSTRLVRWPFSYLGGRRVSHILRIPWTFAWIEVSLFNPT